MAIRFSTKLCGRKEPERGCLAKITCSAPKDSSPILQLPPEIRAAIFNYIVSDVDLVFRCAQDFTNFQCVASWADYNRKLSFLQACKLFQAEAWTLIQVKSVTFEKIKEGIVGWKHAVDNVPRLLPDKFGPQEVPLPLCRVRPHLREIRVDPTTLTWMLETNFLSTFPKVQRITVFQTYGLERRGTEFRQKLEDPVERKDLLQKHLDLMYTYQNVTTKFNKSIVPKSGRFASSQRLRLRDILDRANNASNNTLIMLEATTEYNDRPAHGTQCIEPMYPVIGNVSSVKTVYEWTGRRLVSMEVNMWNQPMEIAVKSKYTESVTLSKEELSGMMLGGSEKSVTA